MTTMSTYRRILVAVDGTKAANKGLREAIRLARAERAQLFIVHVVDDFQAYAPIGDMVVTPALDLIPAMRERGKRILARAKRVADDARLPVKTILREMIGGPAADPIVREARKLRADLIVLGTHGRRGVRRLVLGSDAEQVVRSSNVPVLLVRA